MTAITFETTLSPQRLLVAADRCDRCSAKALVRATLTACGELYFCRHHFLEHEAAIRSMCVVIHDETNIL